jgi:hypothetical protein
MTQRGTASGTVVHYEAVKAFVERRVYPDPNTGAEILASTGDTFTRQGVVLMWWVGDDLYATIGDTPHACLWAGKVCCELGITDAFEAYPLRYNGRPIGRDEVIHITGIAATRSRS